MQCFVCGEPMRVVMVEPHQIDMPGFELRTFQCVGCGDVEKRPVFDSERSRQFPALVPETAATAAPTEQPEPTPPATATPAAAAAPGRKKSLFGGFVKLRGSK
jgi:hypothetical protein